MSTSNRQTRGPIGETPALRRVTTPERRLRGGRLRWRRGWRAPWPGPRAARSRDGRRRTAAPGHTPGKAAGRRERLGRDGEVEFVVARREERRLPAVTPLRHVVRRPRDHDSRHPRHERTSPIERRFMFIFRSRMSSVWGQAEKSECPWFRAILVMNRRLPMVDKRFCSGYVLGRQAKPTGRKRVGASPVGLCPIAFRHLFCLGL
jgi:hypothetical protein